MERPPARQRGREVSQVGQRKGRWDAVMRNQRAQKVASTSVCRTEEEDTCPRALVGRDKNVEFIPEGHRELLKAFRQKSVRIK